MCLDENDREILTWIMPSKTWFAYKWLFGAPGIYQYYSNLRGVYHMYVKAHGTPKNMKVVMDECVNVTRRRIHNNLECMPEIVFEAARYYVRCTEKTPPFCIEAHEDAKLENLLPYFSRFHNPATGLPFPIDLIDQEISLPGGLAKEFADEVEAQLLKLPEFKRRDLANYFMHISLQKEE